MSEIESDDNWRFDPSHFYDVRKPPHYGYGPGDGEEAFQVMLNEDDIPVEIYQLDLWWNKLNPPGFDEPGLIELFEKSPAAVETGIRILIAHSRARDEDDVLRMLPKPPIVVVVSNGPLLERSRPRGTNSRSKTPPSSQQPDYTRVMSLLENQTGPGKLFSAVAFIPHEIKVPIEGYLGFYRIEKVAFFLLVYNQHNQADWWRANQYLMRKISRYFMLPRAA